MKNLSTAKLLPIFLLLFSLLSYANEEEHSIIEVKKESQQLETETKSTSQSAYFDRLSSQKKSSFDPYIMTPHKMTYLLPIIFSDKVNRKVYVNVGQWADEIQSVEAKFQFSLKVPLTKKAIFTEDDSLDFGFTVQSWWQVYNQKLSRPFRETNYQPELFYTAPLEWQPFNGDRKSVV